MVGPLVLDGFERLLVAGVFGLPEGHVLAPLQPGNVRVNERRRVLVLLVKPQQFLVKQDRLELGRVGLGGVGLPGHEILRAAKDGGIRPDLEGVFRLGPRLLAAGIELERLLGDEIIKSGPVAVRHGPFGQEIIKRRHRRLLERLRVAERILEMLVDLGIDPGQVPGGKVLARGLGGGGALHEPPAVLLEILPVPVGSQRLEHGQNLFWRPGNFRVHPGDLLLRLVALDVSLQHDLARHRLGRLAVGLVLQGGGDDLIQVGDGGLGQPLADGFLHPLPLVSPRCLRAGSRSGRSQNPDRCRKCQNEILHTRP